MCAYILTIQTREEVCLYSYHTNSMIHLRHEYFKMFGLANIASRDGRVLSNEVVFSVYGVERNTDCT